ncbi:MAG: hypothetical protein ACYS32_09170 [Planctomycetota bacterium]
MSDDEQSALEKHPCLTVLVALTMLFTLIGYWLVMLNSRHLA